MFIPKAQSMLTVHMVLVVISIILIALIPVLGRMLGRIDTSVKLADNEDVVIELTDDDDAEATRSGGTRQTKDQ